MDFIVGSASYDVTCRCSYSFCWNVSLFELSRYVLIIQLSSAQFSECIWCWEKITWFGGIYVCVRVFFFSFSLDM